MANGVCNFSDCWYLMENGIASDEERWHSMENSDDSDCKCLCLLKNDSVSDGNVGASCISVMFLALDADR